MDECSSIQELNESVDPWAQATWDLGSLGGDKLCNEVLSSNSKRRPPMASFRQLSVICAGNNDLVSFNFYTF